MRLLLFLAFAVASPASGQSDAQLADHRNLMRSYVDAFRVLGRSKICRLDFDPEPFFREVARRHGEKSEELRIAGMAYAAGAENLLLGREIDPAPPAPMPCDVVVYMRGMRLPELPPSLVRRGY